MDTASNGGERDTLAPVIPLFGVDRPEVSRAPWGRHSPGSGNGGRSESSSARAGADDDTWHTTWTDDLDAPTAGADEDAAAVARAEDAEAALLKRLRTRSLSEREASAFLRGRDLSDEAVAHVLARMSRLGYLDDAALAEQLVHSGIERKGQGRAMLIQSLGKRGIAREVIEAALVELPDDEEERALDFARQKARAMRDLDRDTALRRLSGQLARRGYGAYALSAARQALDELGRPVRRSSTATVRFE